jgi:hypothetical protein
MKTKLSIIALAVVLSACSSTKAPSTVEAPVAQPLLTQKLSSSFARKGVKVEFDCSYGTGVFGGDSSLCVRGDVKAIEVTAYATSNGNSENLRELAFQVAEDKARGKLSEFIESDIKTSRVTNTLSKNVEKANDRIKQRISNGEEVAMSEEDAGKDTNYAIRENSNDIARQVTETIRVNSTTIQRGVRTIDEKIVDRQTVQVTIRWDKDAYNFATGLKSKFSARN